MREKNNDDGGRAFMATKLLLSETNPESEEKALAVCGTLEVAEERDGSAIGVLGYASSS